MSDPILPINGGAAIHRLTAEFVRTSATGEDDPVTIDLGAQAYSGPWLTAFVHGETMTDRLREAVRIGEAISASALTLLAGLEHPPADDLAEVEVNTLDLDTLTLAAGGHDPDDGEMCVMEAVAFIAGEEWSDQPECASPVIGAFMRTWNDGLDDDDRQELKRHIRRLVGSKGTAEQEDLRGWMALDWLVRVHAPAWLRLAGLDEHADRLAGSAEVRPDTVQGVEPVLDPAWAAARAARDTEWAAARAVRDAARDAAWAAREAARDTARTVAHAARDAAREAAREAARDPARTVARAAAWAAAGVVREVAVDTAWAAMWTAARGNAWDLTHRELHRSAHELVDRMLAVTEGDPDDPCPVHGDVHEVTG